MTDKGTLRVLTSAMLLASSIAAAQPQLSGTYDVGTLTPLERPAAFGDHLELTPEEAEQMRARIATMMARDAENSDPDRAAPPKGQFSNGYNLFWVDPGSAATLVDGKFRTSIITSPANGQKPPMTQSGKQRMNALLSSWTIVWRNPDPTVAKDGATAWWLEDGNPDGPYDNIEQRPVAERCIIGSRSTGGPPMLPNVYNNYKRIIQTDTHVMILTEMIHDARIIRLNSQHPDASLRFWLGDSIGWYEGDSLVVETKNFGPTPALSGASANMTVIERFTAAEEGNLLYQFTVDDPQIWTEPWSGEYTWQRKNAKVYEFACHEGNYALGNIMRGARQLEREHAN